MTETDRRARIAGGLYLLSSLPAFFSLRYVPDTIIVRGDPAATITNIERAETLFRLGIAGELLGAALWVLLIRALYRLFADVDRGQAWLMAALGLMTVPILFVNVLPELAVLALVKDPAIGGAFPAHVREGLVALAFRVHGQAFTIAGVFWGLWLFPFAVLVWRCGFLPRALGVLLAIGGAGWLVQSAIALTAPSLTAVVGPVASFAAQAGELPIIFWLLVVGARPRAPAAGTVAGPAAAR
jgi:hypothetical protein